MFLVDQPEIFQSINFIPGFEYRSVPVLFILAGLWLFCLLILFFINKKIKKFNFSLAILALTLVFWLPLYANSFYNNLYDLSDNWQYYSGDNYSRQKFRLCQIDKNQNLGETWCNIFALIDLAKNIIPQGANLKIITNDFTQPYLVYFFYPRYHLIADIQMAKYLVLYRADNIFYLKNNFLYQGDKNLGNYKLLAADQAKNYFILMKN